MRINAGITEVDLLNDPTINLLLVMVLIWTSGVVFRKIKQPPMLGELLGGIIFGPCLLGIIRPDATLQVLSELGVFFLMFYAGLETDPFDLKKMGRLASLVGCGGFVLPFLLGLGVCFYIFEVDLRASLFVGLALAITAIAVNARVLKDMNLLRYRVTPVIIGASIIDDVLSFLLLSMIACVTCGNGSLDWRIMAEGFGRAIVFFGVTTFIGLKLYPLLSKYFSSRESMGFTFSLIVALVFGLMAELAGLHIILGAYMAGLFVREGIVHKALFQKINDRFVSITYGFLGPIFFVSLSFHMTFDIFQTHLEMIAILLGVAVLGKMLGAGGCAWLGGMNFKESSVVAFCMNGRGAVELIIASVGIELGVINDTYFSILVVVALITTLIPPVFISALFRLTSGREGLQLIPEWRGTESSEAQD